MGDNFEQLFTDWKKINHDSSEALNLLQQEKNKYYEENAALNKQLKECRQEIKTLTIQNRARKEQCDHLLQRCAQYQQLQNGSNNDRNKDAKHENRLRFNYQQKKNEVDEILHQIQKLFLFCNDKYPQITNANSTRAHMLDDIEEDMTVDDDMGDEKKQLRSVVDRNVFKKRRSLNFIYDVTPTKKNKHIINNNQQETKKKNEKKKKRKARNENVDAKISSQLLGPSTSSHGNDPFGRPQSSHSFFNESPYRYNKVPLNMSSKLWAKRDSLVRKKKAVRINAIPSSAGSTPLTTPHQSHRGKLSDDEDDDIAFCDDDPHQKYLQMMGTKDGQTHTQPQ